VFEHERGVRSAADGSQKYHVVTLFAPVRVLAARSAHLLSQVGRLGHSRLQCRAHNRSHRSSVSYVFISPKTRLPILLPRLRLITQTKSDLQKEVTYNTELPISSSLLGTKLGIGWMGSAYVTGWLLLAILLIMIVSSMNFVRRKDHFEVFYFFHLLYIPFFVVCLLHAPNLWKWLLLPGLLFLVEQIIRFRNRGESTLVREGTILPSEVLHLVIERPPNFHYKPGDWLLVKIPDIARREWHPFTISSAPERSDRTLSLHIRVCGEWTRKLYQKYAAFENVQVVCSTQPTIPLADLSSISAIAAQNRSNVLQCTLDVDDSIGRINPSFLPDHGIEQAASAIASGSSTPLNSLFARNPECIALASLPRGKDCRLFNECPRLPSPNKSISIKLPSNPSSPATSAAPSTGASANPAAVATADKSAQQVDPYDSELIRKTVKFPMRVLLDGPYGSASSDIFQTEHALLIAPGIGVTPFASILQSIVMRYEQSRHQCPKCEHGFTEPRPTSLNKLRKVDFVWINRDQRCFEWFVQLMAQLELTQQQLKPNERFLDMHVYVTSARDVSDMKAIGLQLALDLLHERQQRDLITGLKTRTRPGRPNWDVFFNDIARQRRGKVTVFFCGGALMGRTIQNHCQKYGFAFRKENF
jgi:hypothetical protein